MKPTSLRWAVALLLSASSTLSHALVFAVNEGVTYRVPNEEIRAKYAAIAADLSKLLVHRRARRGGVGEALMRAVEPLAKQHGKSLLVLDTASNDAERLYERLEWQRVGAIPGYALKARGGLEATTLFYKVL